METIEIREARGEDALSPAYFKIGDQYFDFVLMVLDPRADRYLQGDRL